MGIERPARRTPVTPEQVFVALGAAWQLLTGTPPDRKTILIFHAQSAFETGHWGKVMNFNLGGIKKHDPCDWTYYATTEDYTSDALANAALASSKPGAEVTLVKRGPGGIKLKFSGKQRTNCFASWEDLDSGARGYIALLLRRFPAAIERAKAGDAKGYVAELKKAKYFTGPADVYAASVDSITRSYGRKLANVMLPTVVML